MREGGHELCLRKLRLQLSQRGAESKPRRRRGGVDAEQDFDEAKNVLRAALCEGKGGKRMDSVGE